MRKFCSSAIILSEELNPLQPALGVTQEGDPHTSVPETSTCFYFSFVLFISCNSGECYGERI